MNADICLIDVLQVRLCSNTWIINAILFNIVIIIIMIVSIAIKVKSFRLLDSWCKMIMAKFVPI